MPYLSSNINVLRRANNLTIEDLAAELGLDRTSVNKWLNNKSRPSYRNLLRLARFFDVPLDDITSTDLSEVFYASIANKRK